MQYYLQFGVVFCFNLCINRGGLASEFSGPVFTSSNTCDV